MEPPILERKGILLQTDQPLATNEASKLHSHGVFLRQQNDGNLVLYRNNTSTTGKNNVIWSSGVSLERGHYFTKIQGDGNMITYTGKPDVRTNRTAVWKTNSARENGAGYRLVLSGNGTALELIQSGTPPIRTWSSINGVQPKPGETVIRQSGPLVGHTTHSSTKIWFLARKNSTAVKVVYSQLAADGSSTGSTISIAMPPRRQHSGSSLAELDGLEASTTYTYKVVVDGAPVAQGQFTTAPPPLLPVKFDYVLASCMNVRARQGYPEQPVWDTILEKKPAFAMFNGDTVYLTKGDMNGTKHVLYDKAWQRNLLQRAEVYYSKFVRNVPTVMTWDDHDYGADNSFHDQSGKENSLAVVKALWANPSYGTPDVTGVFYSYYWGNVHFIVMDGRWHRKKDWSQFGDEQLEWLYDQLLNSRGAFKVIISGATMTTYNDLSWIGDFVTKHNIYGVLFNAGDTHKNEFLSKAHIRWPYNVTQFTSSGIARENWMRPWALLNVDTEAIDPTITVSFYGADTPYTYTTWGHDPENTCTDLEIIEDTVDGRFNQTRCSQTVRLSDLVPEGVSDVVLESPRRGDELIVGSQFTIVWRTFGSNVEKAKLEYSTDSGLSWKSITNGWVANTGSHVWTIPSDPADGVKVRVLATSSGDSYHSPTISETNGLLSIKSQQDISNDSEGPV